MNDNKHLTLQPGELALSDLRAVGAGHQRLDLASKDARLSGVVLKMDGLPGVGKRDPRGNRDHLQDADLPAPVAGFVSGASCSCSPHTVSWTPARLVDPLGVVEHEQHGTLGGQAA